MYPCTFFFVKSFVCQLWFEMKEKTAHNSALYRKTLDSRAMKKQQTREKDMGRRKRGCSFMGVHMRFYALESQRTTSTRHTNTLAAESLPIERRRREREKECNEFVVVVAIAVVECFFLFWLVVYISTACSLFMAALFLCCLKFEYISVPPGMFKHIALHTL